MIDTEPELRDVITRAKAAPRVALDTEFVWDRTFYPKLGVVQLGFSEREGYLIDAVALPTLPHLGELLASRRTEKILHDAQQDLAILARITGVTPRRIFDTRRAAGFAALPSTASLLSLLRDVVNIEIPKTEQRSNWLRRPLSSKQVAYALNDVRFLFKLRDVLLARTSELGNLAYLEEEMLTFDSPDYTREISPLEVFHRLKSGRLRGDAPAVLLELVRWREGVARSRNIPRAHVLRDGNLLGIARRQPRNAREIAAIEGMPRSASTRYRDGILEAIQRGREDAEVIEPKPAGKRRLSSEFKREVSDRLEAIRKNAEAAGIDPALIATKADVVELVSTENDLFGGKPAILQGWRRKFVA